MLCKILNKFSCFDACKCGLQNNFAPLLRDPVNFRLKWESRPEYRDKINLIMGYKKLGNELVLSSFKYLNPDMHTAKRILTVLLKGHHYKEQYRKMNNG